MSPSTLNGALASRLSASIPSAVLEYSAEDIIVGPFDVLLGRGKGMETHPGNQHFQHLIRCNVVRYIHAPHNEAKRQVVMEIIDELECETKGRFLKPTDAGAWVIVPRDEAKKKVAHALQYYQRTLRGKSEEKARGSKKTSKPIIASSPTSTDNVV